jgi:hypothetical protein
MFSRVRRRTHPGVIFHACAIRRAIKAPMMRANESKPIQEEL